MEFQGIFSLLSLSTRKFTSAKTSQASVPLFSFSLSLSLSLLVSNLGLQSGLHFLHTDQTEASCHTFCSISQGNSRGLLFSRDVLAKKNL